jgi:iron complex transport system ATP-binding protein
MLTIQALDVRYDLRPVLQEIDLQVKDGEVIALIGPNGSGKTTLIRAASGVIPVHSGQVCIGNREITHLSAARRARLLAVVPQARNLPEDFSVWQTVYLGRTPYLNWLGNPGTADQARVHWALERTDTLHLANRLVGELSGGEQQRVLLARALAQDTSILLLDEPTAHLDLHHQANLLSLVQQLAHGEGLAVLIALHDLNLASIYADRIALLVEGRLRMTGTPQEVLTPPQLEAAYQVPLRVIPHPDYPIPLVVLDGGKSV